MMHFLGFFHSPTFHFLFHAETAAGNNLILINFSSVAHIPILVNCFSDCPYQEVNLSRAFGEGR